MKAVMPVALPDVMAWRKNVGADQWDEMWEGVLHMPPPPNVGHQDLEGALEAYLRRYWTPASGGKVYHQIALTPSAAGWTKNYRVPDLVLLLPQRFAIDRNEYFEGAPDVAVEIHSPGDEAYEKLPFYAELGAGSLDHPSRHERAGNPRPQAKPLQEAAHPRRWLAPQSGHGHRAARRPAGQARRAPGRR